MYDNSLRSMCSFVVNNFSNISLPLPTAPAYCSLFIYSHQDREKVQFPVLQLSAGKYQEVLAMRERADTPQHPWAYRSPTRHIRPQVFFSFCTVEVQW